MSVDETTALRKACIYELVVSPEAATRPMRPCVDEEGEREGLFLEKTELQSGKNPQAQTNTWLSRKLDASGFALFFTLVMCVAGVLKLAAHKSAEGSMPRATLEQEIKTLPVGVESLDWHEVDEGRSWNSSCKTLVLIIRHCEKEGSERHCNSLGFERAAYLPTLFTGASATSYNAPTALFARMPEPKKYVLRSIETLEPLSAQIGTPINSSFGAADSVRLADFLIRSIRQDRALCESTVLVCWEHKMIPTFANRMSSPPFSGDSQSSSVGASMNPFPSKWQDSEYDAIWAVEWSLEASSEKNFTSSNWRVRTATNGKEGFLAS